MPQAPAGLQEEAGLELNDSPPPPEALEAKVEIFFFTSELPQEGQITWSTTLALRTSSSKGLWHTLQVNSNKGICDSWKFKGFYLPLDAGKGKRLQADPEAVRGFAKSRAKSESHRVHRDNEK
jgi:hypothetical protein